MGVTNRLQYDPTDADSRASGSKVGGLVLDGLTGAGIGKEVLNSVDWLRTAGPIIDSSGNEVGVTGGALDINIAGGSFTSDNIADTTIENEQVLVSTTAVDATAAAGITDRKYLAFANEGNKSLYIGKTGVTTTNGFPLHPGMQHIWRIGPALTPQVIGRTGASNEDLRTMQLA